MPREWVHQNVLELDDGPCSTLVVGDRAETKIPCGRLGEPIIYAGRDGVGWVRYACSDHGGSSPQ